MAMVSQRLMKNLKRAANEVFKEGEEVDTRDISSALRKLTGKYIWSSNEIAGALPKMPEIYIPTGERNIYGLYVYTVGRYNDE